MLGKYKTISLDKIGNQDGFLTSIEAKKDIPFEIKRVYYIYNTANEVVRGRHAHINLEQALICVSGSCKVSCYDGKSKEIFELNSKTEALYIKDLIWHEMFDFSKDCVLLVLASNVYSEKDYIRDYNQFLEMVL